MVEATHSIPCLTLYPQGSLSHSLPFVLSPVLWRGF